MITVHHLENSRSQRVLWLLEELGVDYEIKMYKRNPETKLAPPELLEIHPLGKAPVVTDGEHTLAESGAIIEYLVRKYDDGRLRPAAGTSAALSYTYWLHYAEGSFMPFMLLSLIISRIETAPMPFPSRTVKGTRSTSLARTSTRRMSSRRRTRTRSRPVSSASAAWMGRTTCTSPGQSTSERRPSEWCTCGSTDGTWKRESTGRRRSCIRSS